MKFLVDAHLPQKLKKWLVDEGHDTIHTSELPQQNDTKDIDIINFAEQEGRIIITKDSDFFKYNLIHGKPRRILIIATGNIVNSILLQLFEINFPKIKSMFDSGNEVIEIDNNSITVHK